MPALTVLMTWCVKASIMSANLAEEVREFFLAELAAAILVNAGKCLLNPVIPLVVLLHL